MSKDKLKLPDYSVLMSVYSGEKAEYLKESIESMYAQTHPTNDFVLVCDGKLNSALDKVISDFEERFPESFHPLRLPKCGVGECANRGIEKCLNDYIVKMDSDDIALSQRCEKQIALMEKKPHLTMCGAFIEEFDTDTGERIAIKKTPEKSSEINKYAKRRNPFNNQTLVFHKWFALKAGGYDTVSRCEDYDFVVRMLQQGAVGENIPEVLVNYRVSKSNYERRSNWSNTRSFISVRWRIFRSGYSDLLDFIIPCAMQLGIFILPKSLTGKIYKKFLR